MANKNINNSVVVGNEGYVIYFDCVRVDQFVTDYSVSLGTNATIGTATINMIYVPDLDRIIHTKSKTELGLLNPVTDAGGTYGGSDSGVEYMTNVRIFVKNVFTGKYVQIFGGNITGKATTMSGSEKRLSFQCQDFMNWLNRTVCPIAVPHDQSLPLGDRLKWQAQGIDIDKVAGVNSIADITFKGKNLSQTWQTISQQTIAHNLLYSNPQTVAHWDDAINRVVVMADIREDLREAEVIDFMITTSVTQVDTVYVMMNDVLNTLMFEFFQDRDEVIRIKPPFWNEDVLKNHVIDPSLILSITQSSDFTRMYTRAIATGGLDEWHKNTSTGSSETSSMLSLITPVVAVTSGGTEDNTGCIAVTSESAAGAGGMAGSNIATKAVNIALAQIGKPYVYGGAGPNSFDCSGLIDYAYKQAGYTGFGDRETTYTLVNRGRAVSSLNDIMPGDIILPHSGHVYMAINKNEIVEAQKTGTNIMRRSMPGNFWQIRRLVEWDGVSNTSTTETVKPEKVGSNELLEPTYLEKRYGPLIYECTQPLIKFSNASAVSSSLDDYWAQTNHGSAYWALTKYARYMLNYLNSNVEVSSLQTKAMPWLRPGFNIWVDPLTIDKIYYINSINHYGNESGNYTNLTVSLGRRREEFVNNTNSLGGLKPGTSDDVFVNSMMITPKNFGTVCNYTEVSNLVKTFYNSNGNTQMKEIFTTDNYFKYFYGDGNQGVNFQSESPPPASSSGNASSAPALDRILKLTSPMQHGDDVQNAQTYLTNAGYNPGKIDGWFGANTQYATCAFQADNGLSTDGMIGPLTWAKLSMYAGGGSSTGSNGGGGYGIGTVHVSSCGLCIRNGPGTSFAQIGSLWDGDTVQIISEGDGWYNIVCPTGDGWVSGNYVTKTSEPTSVIDENSNPEYGSKYASYSLSADFGGELSITEIQNKLNTKYNSCGIEVISKRFARLQKLVYNASLYLKDLNESKYTDYPFSSVTGSTVSTPTMSTTSTN